jgi:hypothetical protein
MVYQKDVSNDTRVKEYVLYIKLVGDKGPRVIELTRREAVTLLLHGAKFDYETMGAVKDMDVLSFSIVEKKGTNGK